MARPRTSLSLALAALLAAGAGSASNKYLEAPPAEVVERAPAYRYANLSDTEALGELAQRGAPFSLVAEPTPGVRAPVRLTGPLHGVRVHSALPEEQRRTSPYEILDARLALALDDFCALLAEHDIVEAIHYTMYRPSRSEQAQFRHPGGLAIDIGRLRKRDGTWLDVDEHWPSSVGSRTCGAGARVPKHDRGKELSKLVCAAAERRLFTYMLTPHFDKAHRDHLHLEVKPGVRWFLVN